MWHIRSQTMGEMQLYTASQDREDAEKQAIRVSNACLEAIFRCQWNTLGGECILYTATEGIPQSLTPHTCIYEN